MNTINEKTINYFSIFLYCYGIFEFHFPCKAQLPSQDEPALVWVKKNDKMFTRVLSVLIPEKLATYFPGKTGLLYLLNPESLTPLAPGRHCCWYKQETVVSELTGVFSSIPAFSLWIRGAIQKMSGQGLRKDNS